MASYQDTAKVLAERFIHKGLKEESSTDIFMNWNVPELKMFLKLSNSQKGTTSYKKEQLLLKVKSLWTYFTSNKENMNSDEGIFGVDFNLVSGAQTRKHALTGEKYPPIFPGMKKTDFEKWTMPQLQEYLQDRGVNKAGKKEQLVHNVECAYNMTLPIVYQDIQEEQVERQRDSNNKLILENYMLTLPSPLKLIDGWVKAPENLPNTTYDNVNNYLVDNDAGKAFKGGKSLLESGHLDNVMTHAISPNLRYCFVRGLCLPEQKVSNDQYNVWVCIHKDTAEIICAECSCVAGVSGVCKHVGCLLWFVEKEVREGENLTCTSKPQKWHVPSKRQSKLHQADILNNIAVKKPKADRILLRNKTDFKCKRSDFDPRAVAHRQKITINQADCDILAEATNGNCGLVLLLSQRNVLTEPHPDIPYSNTVEVETSEHIATSKSIDTIVEEIKAENRLKPFDMVRELKAAVKISNKQIQFIQEKTSNQSLCEEWFIHRKNRVTASKFKLIANKVNDDMTIINPTKVKTAVSSICGYYKQHSSKATQWGIENEEVARKVYVENMKKKHKQLNVSTCGFFISSKHPFIGASPDCFVTCQCHGTGLIEIKCPWTHRGLNIKDYASKREACLELIDGVITLKPNHPYYYQVQCQMGVTGYKFCDFFVCTSQDDFTQRINFDNEFWNQNISKVMSFYEKIIVPELFLRTLKNKKDEESIIVKDVLNDMLDIICDDEYLFDFA